MAGPGRLCQPVDAPGAKCRPRTTKSDGLILALMLEVWTLTRSLKVPLAIGVGVGGGGGSCGWGATATPAGGGPAAVGGGTGNPRAGVGRQGGDGCCDEKPPGDAGAHCDHLLWMR